MDRRNFIRAVTVAGGAGVGLTHAAESSVQENASVEWTVKRFSCVTCAIGLETLLR
jgi:hypothetical protein